LCTRCFESERAVAKKLFVKLGDATIHFEADGKITFEQPAPASLRRTPPTRPKFFFGSSTTAVRILSIVSSALRLVSKWLLVRMENTTRSPLAVVAKPLREFTCPREPVLA